ncbi:gag-polypeptide of LTR copia-type [Nitzschia inconspicua]|uniref:Gag-polypeptide of LTR copia-type n=1 Tax=Nitzschia inconspicua TaxID=303405 RepID=A0A9K3KL64_9STRA|nr:gag-polypeptide of LTR copia-type [Nitzschia inconspicua]
MNRKAYLKLALPCDDAVSHQLIKKSTSVDFPQGSAKKAWKALADIWEPKKEVNKQTLTNELFSLKLDDVSKDPEKWILLLQEKQTKLQVMGETISDGLLMSHILGNLPKEYEHVADNLARDSNKTITSVTDELKEKFERMKIAGTVDESEKALTRYKKFSGNCNYCGKQGHKSSQCFKKEHAERNENKKSDKLKQEGKADESGAVVLMAEDIAEEMEEEFSGWTNDPNDKQLMLCQIIHESDVELNHELSLIQDKPILILDDDEFELTSMNDEVYDDNDLVLIIPNDDDSTVHEVEELEVDEVCLTTGMKNRVDDNLMIGDSGATVHMRRDTSGMYDLREEKCVIKYGNGAQSTSTVVGKWAGLIKDNRVLKKVILDGVTVVPGFDHRIETANGFLLAARFEPMELQNESAHVRLKEGTKVQISKFHTMMGHADEDLIRLTAKHMGVILTGKMQKCDVSPVP